MQQVPLKIYLTLLIIIFLPHQSFAFPSDYDGDGKSDLLVWRPSGPDEGKWFVFPSSGSCPWPMSGWYGGCVFQWGLNGDIPLTGDFDGDGKADFAVYRTSNNNWYVFYSSQAGSIIVNFGSTYYNPNLIDEADINGDGISEMILMTNPYDDNQAEIKVRYYSQQQGITIISYPYNFGSAALGGVKLISENYSNVSPQPEPSVYFISTRNYTKHEYRRKWIRVDTDTGSNGIISALSLNFDTDVEPGFPHAIAGNFGGNVPEISHLADFATFSPTDGGKWRIDYNGGGPGSPHIEFWGLSGDYGISGDYDGDQKNDYMVWRPSNGTWYLKPSSGTCPKIFCSSGHPCTPYWYGGCYKQWGLNGDLPLG